MLKYFLGANSGNGFYSLYDGFCSGRGDYLHLIKGGPGCGKSSFMRRIAEKAQECGFDVEYILCSGDPDSLDGIYIPALKTGYADATAPHIIEPRHFGADSDYVNLGQFCSIPPAEDIELCSAKYKAYYTRAYSLLSAAAQIKTAPFPNLIGNAELLQVKRRADSAIRRALGKPCGEGKIEKRFIHCISCMGELVLNDTVDTLCKQIYLLDNKLGLAKNYLQAIIDAAVERKDNIIICLSPVARYSRGGDIPRKATRFCRFRYIQHQNPWRHIRLDAIIPSDKLNAYRAEIKKANKMYDCIIESACLNLAAAKHWHDKLENAYKPYVDFSSLNDFSQQEMIKLFG